MATDDDDGLCALLGQRDHIGLAVFGRLANRVECAISPNNERLIPFNAAAAVVHD